MSLPLVLGDGVLVLVVRGSEDVDCFLRWDGVFVAFLGGRVHDEELEGGERARARQFRWFGDRWRARKKEENEECTHSVVRQRDIVRSRRNLGFPRDGVFGGDGSKTEEARGSKGERGDGWVGSEVWMSGRRIKQESASRGKVKREGRERD